MSEDLTALRNFLELLDSQLEFTEPSVLDSGCVIASVAPVESGLVGIDVETGRPTLAGDTRPSTRSR